MTLMLTGVVKSGTMVSARYSDFVHSIIHSKDK